VRSGRSRGSGPRHDDAAEESVTRVYQQKVTDGTRDVHDAGHTCPPWRGWWGSVPREPAAGRMRRGCDGAPTSLAAPVIGCVILAPTPLSARDHRSSGRVLPPTSLSARGSSLRTILASGRRRAIR